MNWSKNRVLARTINTEPTLTDQAAARDTDINVIVKSFKVTGMVPGKNEPGTYADFTAYPRDLREMMEMARGLRQQMQKLPPQLRNLGPEQLLALTPEQLKKILTPEQTAKPTEETK